MLDRAPCTRNSGPAFSTDLAEWAPEAVMILLAASHKFLVRIRVVRFFIWFESSQCRLGKGIRRTIPETTFVLA